MLLPKDLKMNELFCLGKGPKSRYPNYILTDGSSCYFLKLYHKEESMIVGLAEKAVSDMKLRVGISNTLEIRTLRWAGIFATIQPYLKQALSYSYHGLPAYPALINEIAREHPWDWLFSNHDNHIEHILSYHNKIFFVDKGQAMKFITVDKLDAHYYPNEKVGQKEPVYNLIYRNQEAFHKIDYSQVFQVISSLQGIENDILKEVFEEFSLQYKSMYGRGDICSILCKRKENLASDFEHFYQRIRGGYLIER